MTNGQSPSFDLNSLTKMLGNINIPALANILGSININEILPLITKMMSGGLAGGAPNPGLPVNNPVFPAQSQAVVPQGYGQIPGQPAPFDPMTIIPKPYLQDPRVVVLNTMKPFLPPDKCTIIDSILGILGVIFTVNSVLPHRPASVPVTTPAVSATPVPPPPPPAPLSSQSPSN